MADIEVVTSGTTVNASPISPRTVNKHIENIYRKLGTHDRITTVLRGQAMGFL